MLFLITASCMSQHVCAMGSQQQDDVCDGRHACIYLPYLASRSVPHAKHLIYEVLELPGIHLHPRLSQRLSGRLWRWTGRRFVVLIALDIRVSTLHVLTGRWQLCNTRYSGGWDPSSSLVTAHTAINKISLRCTLEARDIIRGLTMHALQTHSAFLLHPLFRSCARSSFHTA
jgi:hypothetical protein